MIIKTILVGIFATIAMAKETCKILSLSGGGSHGAFEAGVLDSLVHQPEFEPWDVYTGVSAGSLGIMTFLKDNFQENIVYTGQMWKNTRTTDVVDLLTSKNSISGNEKVRGLITGTYEKLRGEPTRAKFQVGVTNLVTESFLSLAIPPENPNLDYIMASTSIPVFFPPYELNENNVYVDGGLQKNEFILSANMYCPTDTRNVVMDLVFANYESEGGVGNGGVEWTFIDIAKRSLNIIIGDFNNMFFKTLMECSDNPDTNFQVNIYMPGFPIKVDVLDFDQGEYMWNLGRFNHTRVVKYC